MLTCPTRRIFRCQGRFDGADCAAKTEPAMAAAGNTTNSRRLIGMRLPEYWKALPAETPQRDLPHGFGGGTPLRRARYRNMLSRGYRLKIQIGNEVDFYDSSQLSPCKGLIRACTSLCSACHWTGNQSDFERHDHRSVRFGRCGSESRTGQHRDRR